MSDGGVLPWQFRIEQIAEKIRKQQADVICLYEGFDASIYPYLKEQLKGEYAHFYFNIGPRAVGASSGIFVASKFAIENPKFIPFPKEILIGRTKNAEKGIFAFDLQSSGKKFARVHTTHLQHSEECAFPTEEEKNSRSKAMQFILETMRKVESAASILTGDLNMDDQEFCQWSKELNRGQLEGSRKTWGGDTFCADLVGKRASPPLNLDHTVFLGQTAKGLHTSLVETGYDAMRFHPQALSDHEGLFSRIYLKFFS